MRHRGVFAPQKDNNLNGDYHKNEDDLEPRLHNLVMLVFAKIIWTISFQLSSFLMLSLLSSFAGLKNLTVAVLSKAQNFE